MPCYPMLALLLGGALLYEDGLVIGGRRLLALVAGTAAVAIAAILVAVRGAPTPGTAQEVLPVLAPVLLPTALPEVLPAWQSFTNWLRASPVSCLPSACLLQTLSEGCLTGVAVGAAGCSAAAAMPQPTIAMAASAVTVLMPSLPELTGAEGRS